MRKTLCRQEDEAKDRTGVKDADRAKDADKDIGCGQRYRMQEGFWLPGAAAGSQNPSCMFSDGWRNVQPVWGMNGSLPD